MFVDAVDDSDDLQNAEAAEGDQRNAFVAFLAPDGERLRHEKGCIAQQGQPKDIRDNFPHFRLTPMNPP